MSGTGAQSGVAGVLLAYAAVVSYPTWSLTDVLNGRPRIRVNQLGYLVGRTMQATVVTDSPTPVEFVVRDGADRAMRTGTSQPSLVQPDPTSAQTVQLLDFTGLSGEQEGCRVEAAGLQSHRFRVSTRLYGDLARDALRFFYLMRSGTPVDDGLAPGYGRPAGHVGRPPNRGDVAVPAWTGPEAERLYPGWQDDGRYDVSGGWYDAGDYGKYVTSGAISVWQLLNTLDLLARRPESATTAARAVSIAQECRWQLDWLLSMQVPPGRPLAGLAFHRVHGTVWSPLPGWPHLDPADRVLHRPSTGAALHLAAATAHGARLLRAGDRPYADRLLLAARTAYDAARRHPQLAAPDDHARFGGGPYGDDRLDDDFYWAATELWLATGDDRYRRDVLDSPQHTREAFDPAGFDYDSVTAPARLDLALAGGFDGHEQVVAGVRDGADRLVELQRRQPWGQPYAPLDGWDWGSNGRILNNLVVLGVAHLVTGDDRYHDAVAVGMDYLLGRNGLGQSYVTGYGVDFSRHQRTRQFGHDLDPAMPPPPSGALAGGANSRPAADFPYDSRLVGLPPQLCYLDEPTSEVTNDVCIRWNAPLVWVATYLDTAP